MAKQTKKVTDNQVVDNQIALDLSESATKTVVDTKPATKTTKKSATKSTPKSEKSTEAKIEEDVETTKEDKAPALDTDPSPKPKKSRTKKAKVEEPKSVSDTSAVDTIVDNSKSSKKSSKSKTQDFVVETQSVVEENVEDKKSNKQEDKEDKKQEEIRKPRILTPEEVNPRLKKEKEKEAKRSRKSKKKKLDLEKVARFTPNTKTGLTADQVKQRTNQGLTNRVEDKNVKTYRRIFFGNIFTFFNLLVFGVAGALIAVGAWTNLMFLVVTICNITIGIIQEIRAKKTIEKISLVSAPTASVLRDSYKHEISVNDIVLDDIIYFSTGKQICTDCKLLEGEVEVNESLLTGESVAIKKRKGDILYSGSFIASGKCTALVERVGEFNYTAKLSAKAKEYKSAKSELLKSLNLVIRCIGAVIIPLAILMYYNNYQQSGVISETIKKTAGSIIGMIPAGMFLLTSMALAVGVMKLAKKRTLVQDLYSIEMLARTDVLCLDKTGTITDGSMKVNSVIQLTNVNHTINDIMGSMLTALEDNNQTSRALATYFGYSKEFTKQIVLPFSSSRKLSAVTFKNGETYVFGAPEYVLKEKNPDVDPLVKQYASKGFRVILLAKCEGTLEGDKVPAKRTPICIIVIEDHIREEAAKTIKWFKDNGVQIKIISGDNPITVSEVSKRVGVENAEKFISLEGLTEQQVAEAADKYTVFGRVSPEQKMYLVKALKGKGHKVAMTGDGVNDILAMKESDCSIAMASGSEATRNVSHLVLLDSNFASMPSVVAEGRRVINNIQKSSSLFLMKTFFTIFLSIFCLIVKTQYPFNTNQIMMLETFVIGVPAFFLSLQPNKEKIQGKFLSNLICNSLPGAIIFTLNVIICFYYNKYASYAGEYYETIASLLVTMSGLLVLFKLCKPFDFYRAFMYIAMIFCCVLVMAVPFLYKFFGYANILNMSFTNWLFILCLVQFSYPLYANIVNIVNKIRFSGENNNQVNNTPKY